jgi:hypothetical protein
MWNENSSESHKLKAKEKYRKVFSRLEKASSNKPALNERQQFERLHYISMNTLR